MIISHERRLIIFADPLNAGTGVMRALAPWGDTPVVLAKDRTEDKPFFFWYDPCRGRMAV
jgi:hypothetical protein